MVTIGQIAPRHRFAQEKAGAVTLSGKSALQFNRSPENVLPGYYPLDPPLSRDHRQARYIIVNQDTGRFKNAGVRACRDRLAATDLMDVFVKQGPVAGQLIQCAVPGA